MKNNSLEVSVIIPTHNRCQMLVRCLDKLAAQNFPAEKFEVIVVADGCSDSTVKLVEDYQSIFQLTLITIAGHGPSTARNKGAEHAKSRFLLFLDDDVMPGKSLIEGHMAVHSQLDKAVVVGPYIPKKPKPDDYLLVCIYEFWTSIFTDMENREMDASFRYVLGGNLSISKKYFIENDGFNEGLRVMEDGEFGYRMLAAGMVFCYAKQADGLHLDTTDIYKLINRKYAEGHASFFISKIHPDIGLPLNRENAKLTTNAAAIVSLKPNSVARLAKNTLLVFQCLKMKRVWERLFQFYVDYSFLQGVARAKHTYSNN